MGRDCGAGLRVSSYLCTSCFRLLE